MRNVLYSNRLASAILGLTLVGLLAACVNAELELSFSGGPTPEETTTLDSGLATQQRLPTPFPSPTMPLPATASATPAVAQQVAPSPTPTAWDQGLPPVITPTPVPPPTGLVYVLDGQLWRIGEDWQPAAMAAEPGDVLSADGQRALRVVGNDIWLIALPGGQRFNLTGNSGRVHCCPQFWP
ncbi:MAG: hypothetical protein PVH18_13850, partial [Chloroflexota bacterium]